MHGQPARDRLRAAFEQLIWATPRDDQVRMLDRARCEAEHYEKIVRILEECMACKLEDPIDPIWEDRWEACNILPFPSGSGLSEINGADPSPTKGG